MEESGRMVEGSSYSEDNSTRIANEETVEASSERERKGASTGTKSSFGDEEFIERGVEIDLSQGKPGGG